MMASIIDTNYYPINQASTRDVELAVRNGESTLAN